MQIKEHLSLDIETFSDVPIKAGTFKYAECCEILLLSYSFNDEPVTCVDLTCESIPKRVFDALTDPGVIKHAYNAAFELACIAAFYEIELPPEQWECTMVRVAMCGLPLSLEMSAAVLRLSDQKDKQGKDLIRFFCCPVKATKVNGNSTRNRSTDYPEKWQRFKDYCNQDVITEKAVYKACDWFPISDFERTQWFIDQHINRNGVNVNEKLIHNAIYLDNIVNKKCMDEARLITGLSNPNSIQQLCAWLTYQTGKSIPTVKKGDVTELLKVVTDMKAKRVLELRAELAKTSIKKYPAMLASLLYNGRICGMLQYYGANRTGRYGGRLVQPQNLPRITFESKYNELDNVRNFCLDRDIENIETFYPSVKDALSQLIRTAFEAEEGKRFIVSDYSSIEARIIAWLAREQWRLDFFKEGGDIYKISAAKIYNIPVETISKESPERQAGKVAELSCGYQGGPDAFQRMLDSEKAKGAKVTEFTKKQKLAIIRGWRENNQNIVQLWYTMEKAAKECIKTGETVYVDRGLHFTFKNNCLLMVLPSGRALCYQQAKLIDELYWHSVIALTDLKDMNSKIVVREADLLSKKIISQEGKRRIVKGIYVDEETGNKIVVYIKQELRTRQVVAYMDVNQTTKKWQINTTYGGKLVENAVQAIARDVLAHGIFNLHTAGYKIVLHVHDETVSEMPEAEGSLEEVNELMIKPEPWYDNMPLSAAGFESKYYKKD